MAMSTNKMSAGELLQTRVSANMHYALAHVNSMSIKCANKMSAGELLQTRVSANMHYALAHANSMSIKCANKMSAGELLQTRVSANMHYALAHVNSMSIKCAIELGIPEILHTYGQPMSLSELVASLQIHPSKTDGIRRVMRVLVNSGIFSQKEMKNSKEEEHYLLTPISVLLLKDEPLTTAPFLLLQLDQALIASFSALSKWFRSSGIPTSFEVAHGMPIREYMARNPDTFNAVKEARGVEGSIIEDYVVNEFREVFEGLRSLVDVGGGQGNMAKAIVEAFPGIRCTVLDLPTTVVNLQGGENLCFVGGNMFEAVPTADAVLLKWVLHYWNDEESVKILKRCKEAIQSKEGGKIIIIDMIMGDKKEEEEYTAFQHLRDMLVMCYHNGKERELKEWEKLLLEAGFSNFKIRTTPRIFSVIEAYT